MSGSTPAPTRAILFDFDGTLADSYDAIIASTNHTLAHFNRAPLPPTVIRSFVGLGLLKLMQDLIPNVDPHVAAAVYREHHPTVIESGTRLLPGVAETLDTLHERGFLLAVCSNKAVGFTRELVRMLDIAHHFAAVLGPDDVAGRAKPLPDMLHLAMVKLGVTPAETLYVGDMTVDVQTARAAGVTVWVIPTGSQSTEELRAAQPDRVLDRFAEIADLL